VLLLLLHYFAIIRVCEESFVLPLRDLPFSISDRLSASSVLKKLSL
jgi:hypothetical protein